MTITLERQKIIDLIVKLLAKAEGTTFEAEAEMFRAKAIQMMADYNIAAQDMKKKEAFRTMDINSGRQSLAKYETTLLHAIADFCGCAILRYNGTDYRFIGTDSDLQAFDYMREVVYRQRTDAWRTYYPVRYGKHPGAKYLNLWKMGFAYRVLAKLDALTKAMTKEVTERGLVLLDPAKQALAWYEKDNKVTAGKATKPANFDHAGYKAGKDVSVNQGLEGKVANPVLQIKH